MTQEQKELLLKDLCSRLPHKLHCRVFKLNKDIKENDDVLYGVIGDNVITLKSDKNECLMYYQIKPYLRPLSTMTDKEKAYYFAIEEEPVICIDWLNKHHFDYRGLIEKGLALEAPEGMFKID